MRIGWTTIDCSLRLIRELVRVTTKMIPPSLTRRQALSALAKSSAALALTMTFPPLRLSAETRGRREFNVRDFGAIGDGAALDTTAIQRAIDAAAAEGNGARVLVPGGRRYLVGSLQLKNAIEFFLADDAELLVSTDPAHYGTDGAILNANDVRDLRLTGTGSIHGRSPEFMVNYDADGEWWRPKKFRPRLAMLVGCRGLEVRDVTFLQAPNWTLHLVGCDGVAIDGVKIRNQMDVPNCDGIDPDHCRNVEIKNCHVVCGDDAIVVKATRAYAQHGGCANIRVSDCVLETQDSGVKIGTESVGDIHDVVFERCDIRTSCRGCTIQLRDEGNVHDVVFRDITFTSRYHSDPWWGRGEAISFTAIPRAPGAKVGQIRNIQVKNVTGRAENSVRISGSPESRIQNVEFDNVNVTLDRWTKYRGGLWDNRPTTAVPGIEEHGNPGIHVRHADDVVLRNCSVAWGANRPDYFTSALEAVDVKNLAYPNFKGEAAHPEKYPSVKIEG